MKKGLPVFITEGGRKEREDGDAEGFRERSRGREEGKEKKQVCPLTLALGQFIQHLDIWRILQGKGSDTESNTHSEKLSSLSANGRMLSTL